MSDATNKGRGRPVQMQLPELTGQEALFMVGFLDRVIAALWQAYGDQMSRCLCGDQLGPRIDLTEEDRAFYERLF